MRSDAAFAFVLCLSVFGSIPTEGKDRYRFPRLEKRGAVTQLIVDGKPFLVLAGELRNSSSSSRSRKT